MSFLTHINRFEDSNYNEDEEMKADSFSDGSEEGLFTFCRQLCFDKLNSLFAFRCPNFIFFVMQVLILEQVEQFFFL